MSKVVLTTFVSLDGVMENPAWTMPYWNDEIANFKSAEFADTAMLLLGRITYEGFAAVWPTRAAEEGADVMNSLPKVVASTTLDEVTWNNSRLIKGDLVAEVTRLKQQPGQDIVIHGSGQLAQTLIRHNLIDEYHLLVYPVVVGSGQRLFQEGTTATLKLISATPFSSGVVALVYHPARENP